MSAVPKITLAIRALHARLQAITQANGYHTDVGNRIYRGRAARELGDNPTLPAITLHPVNDSGENPATRTYQEHRRALQLEAFLDASEQYDEDMDVLLHDIRSALVEPTGRILDGFTVRIDLGTVEFQPPDPGSDHVSFVVPVDITYADSYGEKP